MSGSPLENPIHSCQSHALKIQNHHELAFPSGPRRNCFACCTKHFISWSIFPSPLFQALQHPPVLQDSACEFSVLVGDFTGGGVLGSCLFHGFLKLSTLALWGAGPFQTNPTPAPCGLALAVFRCIASFVRRHLHGFKVILHPQKVLSFSRTQAVTLTYVWVARSSPNALRHSSPIDSQLNPPPTR